ncbi:tyrosine-type recombinase/integrase [Methyloligella solikamskensis]|uniref:Tyrosine-type recombinase/integrase n=1 Tax=Methyloligella solikamskensis TaxID=1177756 RepID=A0ABW3J501_9HYPH
MSKRNAENERAKLRYLEILRHADGRSEQTVRQIEKALLRFEEFTGFASFKTFNQKQAADFKRALSNKGLALATTLSTLKSLKKFFVWLSSQPGYKSRINADSIAYLRLSERDERIARAPADKSYPSLLMVERAVSLMPSETPIEKRDQAMIALAAVTNIRVGALISLKLKHFDPDRMLVLQNPKEVSTKFGKPIYTFLIQLNDDFERIFLDWCRFLREVELFGDNDPLFPKTAMAHDDEMCFVPAGLSREHWATSASAREIFKAAFRTGGLPEFTPHSFRHMLVSEAYRRKLTPAQLKAWSQNLGHESLLTTLGSYGKLSLEEQGQLIREVAATPEEPPLTSSQLEEILRRRGL